MQSAQRKASFSLLSERTDVESAGNLPLTCNSSDSLRSQSWICLHRSASLWVWTWSLFSPPPPLPSFSTSPGCCRCRSPSSRASGRKIKKKKVMGFSPSSSLTKTQGPCRSQWVSQKPHGNAGTPRATSPRCDRVKTPLQNKKNCDRHYSQASELQRESRLWREEVQRRQGDLTLLLRMLFKQRGVKHRSLLQLKETPVVSRYPRENSH